MHGSNLGVDITSFNAIRLIINYWKNIKPIDDINIESIGVGDCHGDLHQFLAPLIINNIIELTGNLKKTSYNKDVEIDNDFRYIFIPEFKIIKSSNIPIIYVGDLIDGGMFSRQILRMIYKLIKHKTNVFYLYGNHECRWIGNYDKFKSGENIKDLIPYSIETFLRGFNIDEFPDISVSDTKIKYKNDLAKGDNFLNNYWAGQMKLLYHMHKKGMMHVCYPYKNIMFSHTTWNYNSLKLLLNKNELENLKDIYKLDINNQISEYKKYSNIINKRFITLPISDVERNKITYTRNIDNPLYFNHVCGHTQPDLWREIGVNKGQATFYEERKIKASGVKIGNVIVYYIDFSVSGVFDEDYVSRPDYVMFLNEKTLTVSNLPGFYFENNQTLIISKDKTKHTGKKESIIVENNNDTDIKNMLITYFPDLYEWNF